METETEGAKNDGCFDQIILQKVLYPFFFRVHDLFYQKVPK